MTEEGDQVPISDNGDKIAPETVEALEEGKQEEGKPEAAVNNNNDAESSKEEEVLVRLPSIESLLVRLKDNFGVKVSDRRLAKSMVRLNKLYGRVSEKFEKSSTANLTRTVKDELEGVARDLKTSQKSDAAGQKILEVSVRAVQQINLLRKNKEATNKKLCLLHNANEDLLEITSALNIIKSHQSDLILLANDKTTSRASLQN